MIHALSLRSMRGKKQQRFAEIKTFGNVFELPEGIADRWPAIFNNPNPIVLELACGKGEYAVNMAKAFPDKNFIGVDIKGNRMYVGAKKALQEQVTNVAFLRTRIEQLTLHFHPQSVSEIWITFPDPFLRDSRAKNRLTHHKFLAMYQQLLQPGGLVHLKTDSDELFAFTLEMIAHHQCPIVQQIDNVYAKGQPEFPLNIQTYYEGMHLLDNRTIHYVSFRLPDAPIVIPPKKKQTPDEAAV
jgi:tRNA (guanine-N7-)-methyltransferase